jgi:hypothetical protein
MTVNLEVLRGRAQVERGEQRRLPFMHVDRADDRSETVPKLPSLSKIMNSIHSNSATQDIANMHRHHDI